MLLAFCLPHAKKVIQRSSSGHIAPGISSTAVGGWRCSWRWCWRLSTSEVHLLGEQHTWAMHVHKIIHLEIHLSNLILSCLRCLSYLSMFVYVSSRHQYFGATLLSDSSLSQTIRRLPQCFTWSDSICQNGHMTHDHKRRNNGAIVVNFNMVNDSVKCSLLVATICQTWQVRRCKLVPQWNFAQTSTPALVELAQVWQRATFKGWRNPIIDLRNILWDHSSVLVWGWCTLWTSRHDYLYVQ